MSISRRTAAAQLAVTDFRIRESVSWPGGTMAQSIAADVLRARGAVTPLLPVKTVSVIDLGDPAPSLGHNQGQPRRSASHPPQRRLQRLP